MFALPTPAEGAELEMLQPMNAEHSRRAFAQSCPAPGHRRYGIADVSVCSSAATSSAKTTGFVR